MGAKLFFTLHHGHVFLTAKISQQDKMLDRCWIKPSETKKGLTATCRKSLIFLARLEGFEPPTYGLEVRCSIHLSYRRYRFDVDYHRGLWK